MIARRQEIWDLCRTAARFCLLYDNEARRTSLHTTDGFQRDLVRILAEVHCIAGEVGWASFGLVSRFLNKQNS